MLVRTEEGSVSYDYFFEFRDKIEGGENWKDGAPPPSWDICIWSWGGVGTSCLAGMQEST